MRQLDQAVKDKDIGTDERSRTEKQVDEEMVKQKNELESLSKAKEQEILTV
jgi:ribosome recycling factor